MLDPTKLTREQQDQLLRDWGQYVQQKQNEESVANQSSAVMIFAFIGLGGLASCFDLAMELYIPHALFALAAILTAIRGLAGLFNRSHFNP